MSSGDFSLVLLMVWAMGKRANHSMDSALVAEKVKVPRPSCMTNTSPRRGDSTHTAETVRQNGCTTCKARVGGLVHLLGGDQGGDLSSTTDLEISGILSSPWALH